jgi:putative membrane protein
MKIRTALVAMAMVVTAAAVHAAADVAFYEQATEGGLAEIEAGRLAQQKATSPAIRKFAATMVTAHSKTNDELKAIASKQGVMVPARPAVNDAAKLKVIESLPGERFDSAYVKGQVADHEKMLALLQKEISVGSDKEAQAFAMKVLPDVKMHLAMARELATHLDHSGD